MVRGNGGEMSVPERISLTEHSRLNSFSQKRSLSFVSDIQIHSLLRIGEEM